MLQVRIDSPPISLLAHHLKGMCLGGHLAYRCALDPRVVSAICYFATDIHSHTLGKGKNDDSLARAKDIKGELVMIFGKMDTHVPPVGRDLIRKTLHEAGVTFSFYEPAWAQREYLHWSKTLYGANAFQTRSFATSSARDATTLHCLASASRCSKSYSTAHCVLILDQGLVARSRSKTFADLLSVELKRNSS